MVFVDRINKGTLCQVQRQEEKELGMVQELKEVDMKCGERRRGILMGTLYQQSPTFLTPGTSDPMRL